MRCCLETGRPPSPVFKTLTSFHAVPGLADTATMGQPWNLVWAKVAPSRLRARASSFCRFSSGSRSTYKWSRRVIMMMYHGDTTCVDGMLSRRGSVREVL